MVKFKTAKIGKHSVEYVLKHRLLDILKVYKNKPELIEDDLLDMTAEIQVVLSDYIVDPLNINFFIDHLFELRLVPASKDCEELFKLIDFDIAVPPRLKALTL